MAKGLCAPGRYESAATKAEGKMALPLFPRQEGHSGMTAISGINGDEILTQRVRLETIWQAELGLMNLSGVDSKVRQ
ncbi:MAG: hypothetical protein ACRD4Y_03300 [Candidatus Acidiferrales bacterium]